MKKYLLLILLPLILFAEQALSSPEQDIKEIYTINSYRIWLLESAELPIVNVKIAFKGAGAAFDESGKEGTAFLLSQMLLEGAGNFESQDFKKELEKFAIELDFDVDKDNFYITLKTLEENIKRAFDLLSLALSSPIFDEESLKRVKAQVKTFITKNLEDPEYLAAIKWNENYYKSHPYGSPTYGYLDSIDDIERIDLINFKNNFLSRSNMQISAVGYIGESEITNLVEGSFRDLSKTPKKHSNIHFAPSIESAGTVRIEKDIPQSIIMFGHEGLDYHHKDFYALYVLNHILGGGGFQSRLIKEIREKRGLSYSTYTYLASLANASLFKGYVGTKNSDEALKSLIEQLEIIKNEGVTEEELIAAKNYLIGSFPLKLDSNSRLVDFISFMQLEELGIDYIEKRDSYINSVTVEDIKRVAKEIIRPENLLMIIVGKAS